MPWLARKSRSQISTPPRRKPTGRGSSVPLVSMNLVNRPQISRSSSGQRRMSNSSGGEWIDE
jgi:hypothetical protein